jgi:hypothetical protein
MWIGVRLETVQDVDNRGDLGLGPAFTRYGISRHLLDV